MKGRSIAAGALCLLALAVVAGCDRDRPAPAAPGAPAARAGRTLTPASPYKPLEGQFVRFTFTDGLTADGFLIRASADAVDVEFDGDTHFIAAEKIRTLRRLKLSEVMGERDPAEAAPETPNPPPRN